MMGSDDKPQGELFYAFTLEDTVPQDHLLRDIDRVLDLSELREHLAPYYSHTARPSVDPELMIRMLLIGYCCGIRSVRQLCYEVTMHLAYRWLRKLKITDPVPHHSTFSKNRHGRFRESEAFRFQVQMLFAHTKRILKVERLRLRGLSGARDEFLLTATAQNLRRMAKLLGTGPPEDREMAIA